MSNANLIIQRLMEANPLREPVLRSIIQSLHLPSGSRGLDVGCGIGLQSMLLAEQVGAGGHITAMDITPALLRFGESQVIKAGLSDRVSFREGDMRSLPFAAGTFDWVWSADCAGYPAGELLPVLKEMMRVIRPGGKVFLLAWSSQQLLPGYPLLEARLNAACSSTIPYLQGIHPDLHFLRAPHWFREAGFEDVYAQTFVGDIQAPLAEGVRAALISLFEMLWTSPQPAEVSAVDWQAYQRLCSPASADFILNDPDFNGFFTYTLFEGKHN